MRLAPEALCFFYQQQIIFVKSDKHTLGWESLSSVAQGGDTSSCSVKQYSTQKLPKQSQSRQAS